MSMTVPVAATTLNELLTNAYYTVQGYAILGGDALVAGGRFLYPGDGILFKVWNTNNHQLTWSVLRTALWAMKDFINSMNEFKTMAFAIYDGVNMVGKGTITMVENGSGSGSGNS